MDNNALLMLAGSGGTKVKPGTIGVQGELGFGGGLYPGDKSDLTAIGLTPMPNNNDPTNENFGSYIHTNGSVMLFIPAFCYRVGNTSAPSYSRDMENALEIRDASLGETDGFILHRAFIDGGKKKLGFFIDKYLCSKDSTGKLAISVKNGDPIALYKSYVNSSSMPDCVGKIWDAITLGRARGNAYSCISAFMFSAIAMLSLAHGQAAKSTATCAWFDPNYRENYPKGNNNSLKDIDEPSLTFVQGPNSISGVAKTGSASNISKTTHTGQVWGVTDVNGNMWQLCLGWRNPSNNTVHIAKESVSMHSFTLDNRDDTSLFDTVYIDKGDGKYYWGASAFYKSATGLGRAMCGINPSIHLSDGIRLFGNDHVVLGFHSDAGLIVGGSFQNRSAAGVFFRDFAALVGGSDHGGVRVGGYAN